MGSDIKNYFFLDILQYKQMHHKKRGKQIKKKQENNQKQQFQKKQNKIKQILTSNGVQDSSVLYEDDTVSQLKQCLKDLKQINYVANPGIIKIKKCSQSVTDVGKFLQNGGGNFTKAIDQLKKLGQHQYQIGILIANILKKYLECLFSYQSICHIYLKNIDNNKADIKKIQSYIQNQTKVQISQTNNHNGVANILELQQKKIKNQTQSSQMNTIHKKQINEIGVNTQSLDHDKKNTVADTSIKNQNKITLQQFKQFKNKIRSQISTIHQLIKDYKSDVQIYKSFIKQMPKIQIKTDQLINNIQQKLRKLFQQKIIKIKQQLSQVRKQQKLIRQIQKGMQHLLNQGRKTIQRQIHNKREQLISSYKKNQINYSQKILKLQLSLQQYKKKFQQQKIKYSQCMIKQKQFQKRIDQNQKQIQKLILQLKNAQLMLPNNKQIIQKKSVPLPYQFLLGPSLAFWSPLLMGYEVGKHDYPKKTFSQQRNYLIKTLEEYTKKTIKRTKLIYSYDNIIQTNFHPYVDNIPNYVVIMKLKNEYMIGAYSQKALTSEGGNNGPGFISSLTNKITIQVETRLNGVRTTSYNPYYMVFGNDQFRFQPQKKQVISYVGYQFSFYRPKITQKDLFGIQSETTQFESYQVHKVVFVGDE